MVAHCPQVGLDRQRGAVKAVALAGTERRVLVLDRVARSWVRLLPWETGDHVERPIQSAVGVVGSTL